MARKEHVHADQIDLGGYVSNLDEATLPEVAAAFDISEGTARRNLDGLVAQGLLEVEPGTDGQPRTYFVPGIR